MQRSSARPGISALLLVVLVSALTLVSIVVIAGINSSNTISNYQLTQAEVVQAHVESCINDALWRINAVKPTEGSFNMSRVDIPCSYKIGAAASGLKTVTSTASTTNSLGTWSKTVVVFVNVSSTPIRIDSYKDNNYYDTISASSALCGDWYCTGSDTCTNCAIDCGEC